MFLRIIKKINKYTLHKKNIINHYYYLERGKNLKIYIKKNKKKRNNKQVQV